MDIWGEIQVLLSQLEESQQQQLYALARRIVPTFTQDDMLQPNDFPELENHPNFRYEEGVLAGIKTAHMALLALKSDQNARKLTRGGPSGGSKSQF
jgi:hypothetical protein